MDILYNVSLREDGKWQVLKKGNKQPTRVFELKDDAVEFANEIAERNGAKVQVLNHPKFTSNEEYHYDLEQRSDGKWQFLRKGNKQPTRVFENKEDALEYVSVIKEKENVIINLIELEETEPEVEVVEEPVVEEGLGEEIDTTNVHDEVEVQDEDNKESETQDETVPEETQEPQPEPEVETAIEFRFEELDELEGVEKPEPEPKRRGFFSRLFRRRKKRK